ncbi:Multidrug resistance regulator 1, partial [Paraphaeosphaeria sporulosa]
MRSDNKGSRPTPSCTECQRRKQKCSREWPCNHCQARKIPRLCQFGTKKSQQPLLPESASRYAELRGRKRTQLVPTGLSSDGLFGDHNKPDDGLEIWGYMPGHIHFNLGFSLGWANGKVPQSLKKENSDAVEGVLHAMPDKSITDAIVNHFLAVVNYRYSAIHGPTFINQYVRWWSDRVTSQRLSPKFTCLLLRVLSYSVQYLPPKLQKMIEFGPAGSPKVTTDRFHDAAEQLSNSFSTSDTCVERVQELFFRCAWLRLDSRIVESWHALGRTIREAQELGLDKEFSHEGQPEIDVEIRRHLWSLLYTWDWQMSAWLGRPHMIDQKGLSFEFPNLRLDQSASEPNLLSPFAHVAVRDLSPEQVPSVLEEIRNFVDELPPVFRIEGPDISLDELHPYYIFQRYQLHLVIHMAMLDPLKSYLTRGPSNSKASQDAKLRKTGVEVALKLLEIARLIFDHEFPNNATVHIVGFCIFDTAITLCSAVIHDIDSVLPHRESVISAIENVLDMLQQLSTTKLGASSYCFLLKLIQLTPVLSQYAPITKRQWRIQRLESSRSGSEVRTSLPEQPLPTITVPLEPRVKPASPAYNPVPIPEITTTDDLAFDVDQYLAQNPFG